MEFLNNDWSSRHKRLSIIIRREDCFNEAISLILDLHSELHQGIVSSNNTNPIDNLMNSIKIYDVMPSIKDETIAWAIWHIARIEDLTMNILVKNQKEVYNKEWEERINSPITDTGNALTDDEIINFSKQIRFNELLKYRIEVGKRSQEIIKSLNPCDFIRRITNANMIKEVRGVTDDENSIWLIDFWGKKDVAGIILMPLTRHQTLHLNDCYKWNKKLNK